MGFLDTAASFPTAVFTTLLVVALFYWLLALIGAVDFEAGGHHAHLESGDDVHGGHAEGDADVGALATYVVAWGLHGVPTSIAVSLLVLIAWVLSCLGGMWVLPMLPAGAPAHVGGVLLALASISIAVPLTSRLIRPLRGLFVTHTALHNASLVGQPCKVLTQVVDERAGRAEVAQRGANLNIRVWARTPNQLKRGATARIVAYQDNPARYLIEPDT
jgi:hypothetical protein